MKKIKKIVKNKYGFLEGKNNPYFGSRESIDIEIIIEKINEIIETLNKSKEKCDCKKNGIACSHKTKSECYHCMPVLSQEEGKI